jgi:hypothetical protein
VPPGGTGVPLPLVLPRGMGELHGRVLPCVPDRLLLNNCSEHLFNNRITADARQAPVLRVTDRGAPADELWVLLQTGSSSSNLYLPYPSQPGRVGRIDLRTGRFAGRT